MTNKNFLIFETAISEGWRMDKFFRMRMDASLTFPKCKLCVSRCQPHKGRGASLGLLEFEGGCLSTTMVSITQATQYWV